MQKKLYGAIFVLLGFMMLGGGYKYAEQLTHKSRFSPADSTGKAMKNMLVPKKNYTDYRTDADSLFIIDSTFWRQGWDTLPQARFWYEVMRLTPDSILVNVAAKREVLLKIPTEIYMTREREEREAFKDSVKQCFLLPEDEEIYVTSGRRHFYKLDQVVDSLYVGIEIFRTEGVNPWYAQAILMIESPNQLLRSPAGAYGPFQLMKSIAQKYGLKVSKHTDERTDLRKSATAAAKLLQEVCIPKTKEILDAQKLPYQEKALWFRLLVLHVYHAGAKNVAAVVKKIDPDQGGMALIKALWQTQDRNFKNASQNYSQLALAAHIFLAEILETRYNLAQKPKILTEN